MWHLFHLVFIDKIKVKVCLFDSIRILPFFLLTYTFFEYGNFEFITGIQMGVGLICDLW